MALRFKFGELIAIGFEAQHGGLQGARQPRAAGLEKRIDHPPRFEKIFLLLLVGSLGLFDERLALRDKVGGCGRIVLAQEGVGDPGAAEFEIDKAHDELAVRPRKAQIEHVDRVELLRRVVVPETGGGVRQQVGDITHLLSPRRAGGSHRDRRVAAASPPGRGDCVGPGAATARCGTQIRRG